MAKRRPNSFFRFQQFTIFHDKCAMKVGTDGVLLGAWVDVTDAYKGLDIGTGTGLIALMAAQRNHKLKLDAIDIDKDAVIQAKENVNRSPFAERINVEQSAIQDYSSSKKYDMIVSNPPYFNESLKPEDKQRTLARHTDSLLVEELISSTTALLNDIGRLSIIYPYEYKERLIQLSKKYNLHVTRIANVYPTPKSEPKRILIELSKQERKLEEKDLVIEIERHIYSKEFSELVKDFYLKK